MLKLNFCRRILIFCLILSLQSRSTSHAADYSTREIRRFGNGTAITAAWGPDSKMLAVGGSLGLWLYSPYLKPIAHLDKNESEITALAWHPNGKQIATTTRSRAVQLWDISSGTVQTLAKPQESTSAPKDWADFLKGSLSFSPDGSMLISTTPDPDVRKNTQDNRLPSGTLDVWDVSNGKRVMTFKTVGPVAQVAWNPDGKRLLVNGAKTADFKDDVTREPFAFDVGFVQVLDGKSGRVLDALGASSQTSHCNLAEDFDEQLAVPNFAQWTEKGKTVIILNRNYVCTWNVDPGAAIDILEGDIGGTSQTGVAASPDGQSIVIERCHDGCGLQIGAPVGLGYVPLNGEFMIWSPDSRFLAILGEGRVSIIDRPSINVQVTLESSALIEPAVALDTFGEPPSVRWLEERLVYTDYTYDFPRSPRRRSITAITWKDLFTGETIRIVPSPVGLCELLVPSPDDKWIVAASNGSIARVHLEADTDADWGLRELPIAAPDISTNADWFSGLYWSPNSKRVAGVHFGNLTVWDVVTGKSLAQIAKLTSEFSDSKASWSPDSRLLVVNYFDAGYPLAVDDPTPAYVIDSSSGKKVFELTGAKGRLNIAWEPQARNVAAVTADHKILIWQLSSGRLVQTLSGKSLEWSADGNWFALITDKNTVQIYDAVNVQPTVLLNSISAEVTSTTFSPDSRRIAVATRDGDIQIYDVKTGKTLLDLRGHKSVVQWVKWKADGTQLLSRSDDLTLRLWDVR
jgi:WD40 repeat protein